MSRLLLAIVLALTTATACVDDNPPVLAPSQLDVAYYRCRVQPIWDRSCSALACHGDGLRAFHVFTRNRMRLDAENIARNVPLTAVELDANYQNSIGFAAASADASWLLRKPLDETAGGYFHLGKDIFEGDDVWVDKAHKDYVTVDAWLSGETADPNCIYAGSQP